MPLVGGLPDSIINDLQQLYLEIDGSTGNGLSKQQLIQILASFDLALSEHELKELMSELVDVSDQDAQSGKLDFAAFCTLMTRQLGDKTIDAELREAFGSFDKDGDSRISDADLHSAFKSILNQNLTTEEVSEMMTEIDISSQGAITYPDFAKVLTSK
eukprot:gnl/Hemi2/9935_TR3443_c0_g1_i1.p1 gnl/Hemi2/9935_TR3443_c0_g1~~gnl/Hemi2/9935_TR3443_c0_g1_i1.p1  ORF type:complete len:158 (-),score=42.18 gnl/Hemi2/9935_TR3443_c0_g1_i1:82-555(-)